MDFWLGVARTIDNITERLGRLVFWLTLAMVLLGALNAIARKAGQYFGATLTSNAFVELQWYMFGAVFLLGAGYALKHNAHVRVDVLYGRLDSRKKAYIDVAGTILFLLPFCILVQFVSWPAVINSWQVWEQSPDPDGLPRYPIKTLIPVAFFFVTLQGISHLIKKLAFLKGRLPETLEEEGVGA
jgi:TRAP-type mannitol/chloroaromatic compound transport system permease small subunit